MPVIDYLVAHRAAPSRSGSGYDYILAGDGVFVAANNSLLEVRIPVASCTIRGLAPVYAMTALVHGRVTCTIWDILLRCLRSAQSVGCEVLVGVAHEDTRGYVIVVPEQNTTPVSIDYAPHENWLLEIHSHVNGPAYFSATDTADEQRLRIYGVVGLLDQPRPQVALRAGAYGYFLAVPWSSVFEGDTSAVDDVFGRVESGTDDAFALRCQMPL